MSDGRRGLTRLNLKAVSLYNQGLPVAAVASELGVHSASIYRTLHRAREAGVEVRSTPHNDNTWYHRQKLLGNVKQGNWPGFLAKLPEEVATWLARNVPEGATLAELIAAIVLDAYADETENP
jgi:DNA-binding transcriptional regulator LsrR (DeoR family)